MDTDEWKKDYKERKTNDCPCCGKDYPEHGCGECHSDIGEEECWKNAGYCGKCYALIHNTLPKIRMRKEELDVACKCDEPTCGKCLGGGCKDDNCPTHAKEAKAHWH